MPPKRKHSAEAANLPPKRSRLSNLLESHERDDEDQIIASEASVSGPPSSSYPDTSNPHEDYISQNFNGAPTFSQVSDRSDCLNFTPLNVVIAEGNDLFSPLRATCDALQAVIRMETESIKNGEWARLIKMLRFHLATVENQLVKLDEDRKIDGSTPPFDSAVKESLQSYASKLKDIYNFTKNKETDTGPNSGVLGKRLQDFEDTFANYTKTLHLFVARRVEQMRNSLSQAGSVLMNNAMNAHSSRAEDINVYGVQHRQCLPGTRIKTLDAIRHWENDENSTDQMFCLLDFAGSGKSTVSKHMDLEWDRGRKLMARFFFSRDTAETMSTKRFCSVVANKFASRDETFKEVMREFENQPDYGSLSLEQQFDGFIVDPLKALNRRAILIIDALDECDNEHGHRDRLLEVISNHLSAIPHLRVLVTGRPELDIKQWAITTAGVRCTNFFDLEGNNDDVGRYIEQRLRNWPSSLQARVYDIVERAEGVFIWARIACDLLCKTKDVQAMLASLSEEVTLDHLYTIALEQSIPKDKHSRRVAVMVLEMVLALQRPLSVAEVAQLSPNPEAIEAVVNSLGSILLYKDRGDPIRLIHATLREYLTSATKSGPWFIQLGRGHYFLASGCIDLATRAEQGPGSDIEEDTFKSAIRYSWDSWIAHCGKSSCKLGLNERIAGFIDTGYEYLLDDSTRAPSGQFITNVVSLCRRNMSPYTTQTIVSRSCRWIRMRRDNMEPVLSDPKLLLLPQPGLGLPRFSGLESRRRSRMMDNFETKLRQITKEMNIDLEDNGKHGGFDQSPWLARGPRMDTADYRLEQLSRRLGDEPNWITSGSGMDTTDYNVGQSLRQLTNHPITNRIPSGSWMNATDYSFGRSSPRLTDYPNTNSNDILDDDL